MTIATSRFLYAQDSPVNLAVLRITLCVTSFGPPAHAAIHGIDVPSIEPTPPDLLGDVLVALPRSESFLRVVAAAFAMSCALGALGAATRWAMAGVAMFGAIHLGVPQIFGKVDHNHYVLWIALVLAVSPCGDALSLDSRGNRRSPSPRYGFPLRVTWILIGLIYFFPGMWKLGRTGLDWVSADNMARLMWSTWFAEGGYLPIVDISGNTTLLTLAGVMTVVIELGFVFFVFSQRTRPLAIMGGVCFHVGVGLTMGIWFVGLLFMYVALVDWDPLIRRVADLGPPSTSTNPKRPTLLSQSVLGALVVSVLLAGAGRSLNGWPVASFPDFGYEVSEVIYALELDAGRNTITDEALPALSSIETQRLLYAASEFDEARATLAHDLSTTRLCADHPAAVIEIRRTPWNIGVGEPTRAGPPEFVEVLTCSD